MIAWAMGAATGHTALALWRDGELFVCESNAKVPSLYFALSFFFLASEGGFHLCPKVLKYVQ